MLSQNQVILNQVKIMSNNTEGKEDNWSMAIGFYPGLLFGVRTYEGPVWSQMVFYIPFIDLAIEWKN